MPENRKKFRRDKKEKVDRIMSAFLRLLREQGYDQVSTNHVADEAGVGIGTVYRYFPEGKAALIRDAFDWMSSNMVDLEALVSANDSEIMQVLRKFVEDYVKSHRENREAHIAIEIAHLTNPELFTSENEVIRDYFRDISKKLIESVPFYYSFPLDVLHEKMVVMFHTLEAYAHRHLFITPIFENDDDLVDFLFNLMGFIFSSSGDVNKNRPS